MEKGIMIAGNMIVDKIKYIEAYPKEHNLTTISGEVDSLGGLACNCLLNIAKLDSSVPLKALGIVGDDSMGDYILKELSAQPSIDTDLVFRGGTTSYTDVMTTPNGGRTFFQYRGANAFLSPNHFDFTEISVDLLHIGYLLLLDLLDGGDEEYPTAMCRVLDMAQQQGIKTSIDVVSEESDRFERVVAPALQYTDYCIINEVEASKITGVQLRDRIGKLVAYNLPKALKKLLELGVSGWAIIHTPELSCGMEKASGKYIEKESWYIPPKMKISSVGAGDAFASTILYGIYNNWSLEKAIETAGAVAAYSLSGAGASDAMMEIDKIMVEMIKLKTEGEVTL